MSQESVNDATASLTLSGDHGKDSRASSQTLDWSTPPPPARRSGRERTTRYDLDTTPSKPSKSVSKVKSSQDTPTKATIRRKIRDEIEQTTKAHREVFLNHHWKVFEAVLPEKNYLAKLEVSDDASITEIEAILQPDGITATMKPHQLEGLSFLVMMHHNGMPAILGDEMGLGKTLQTLSFIQWLKEHTAQQAGDEQRPCLVVCPLSVLSTWEREAKRWAPTLVVSTMHGLKKRRLELRKQIMAGSCDLCLTTYETFVSERYWFSSAFVWRYIILDEGHKIKNEETAVSTALRGLSAENRLLLTGTPLQNDLKEMWALLHWMLPDVFSPDTASNFKSAFDLGAGKASAVFLDHARRLLEIVMIRRMKDSPGINLGLPPKEEVLLYIPLTVQQREWYMKLITRMDQCTFSEVFKDASHKESASAQEDVVQNQPQWKKLMNLIAQLRKVCSHPYLIKDLRPEHARFDPSVRDTSGKFIVLDKLVDEVVIRRKKKLIVFSGYTRTLDLLEDLLYAKSANRIPGMFKYARLDGSTPRAKRNLTMRLFNDTEQNFQVILISTRAGGLGITLISASDVCFLDEDWNPQITLQAEARAHRIGQTEKVTIYKLCTQGTVEEQMLGRIRKKLYLSTKVTEEMQNLHTRTKRGHDEAPDAEDVPRMGTSALMTLLRRGSKTLTASTIDVEMMSSWTWEEVVGHCQYTTHEDAALDEQDWLAQVERVETSIFEGRKLYRSPDKKAKLDTDLVRADRRIGKNTMVEIDEFAVDKHSMLCDEWEAAPTLAGKHPELAEYKHERENFDHQDSCQVCGLAGGSKCTGCPRIMHSECLNDRQHRSSITMYCPQHRCCECDSSVADAGGLIYRCRWCVNAYCEDCLDFHNAILLDSSLPEFEMLGYSTDNAWFIECQSCVTKSGGDETYHTAINEKRRDIELAWVGRELADQEFEMELEFNTPKTVSEAVTPRDDV